MKLSALLPGLVLVQTVSAVITDDYSSGFACQGPREGETGLGTCNDYITDRACSATLTPIAANTYRFGYLSPLSGSSSFYETTTNAGMLCALHKFNNANTLQLEPVFGDTEADTGRTTEASLCLLQGQAMTAIVGPAYSSSAVGAATVSDIFKVPVLATTASAVALADDSRFGYFSRVYPSDFDQAGALASLCRENNWLRVAFFVQTNDDAVDGIDKAFRDFAENDDDRIRIVTTQTFVKDGDAADIRVALKVIKDSGVRVILLLATSNPTTIMEVAKEMGMLGEGWQWLGTDGYIGSMDYVEGFLGVAPFYDETSAQYQELSECLAELAKPTTDDTRNVEYDIYRGLTGVESDPGLFTSYTYDALLFFGELVKNVTAQCSESLDVCMRDHDAVIAAIPTVTYAGITGNVRVLANGERSTVGAFSLLNTQNGEVKKVGVFNPEIVLNDGEDIMYMGSTEVPPQDLIMSCTLETDFARNISECSPTRTVTYSALNEDVLRSCEQPDEFEIDCAYLTVGNDAVVTGVAVIAFGVAVTVGFLVYTLVHWKHKIILLGQKRFLVVLELGALIAQTSVLCVLGEQTAVTCALLPILLCVGITLMFGTLIVKTWRVARIVLDKTMRHIRVSDQMLFTRLGGLLALLFVIFGFILIFQPPYPESTDVRIEEYDQKFPFETCVHGEYTTVLIFFVAAMMLYGCYVAYQIRHIKDSLAESKWIFLSVYNSTLCGVVAVGIIGGLTVTPSAQFVVMSLAVCVASLGNVLFIMVPKVVLISSGSWVNNSNFKSSDPSSNHNKTNMRSNLTNMTSGTIDHSAGPPYI